MVLFKTIFKMKSLQQFFGSFYYTQTKPYECEKQQEGYEWGGGGGREPRRIGCRRDMSGGSSKTAGSQSLRVIFCN